MHGVRDNGLYTLGDEALLLSEVLGAEGFRTAAFVAAYVLDPRFGLDQGFEVYSSPGPARVLGLEAQRGLHLLLHAGGEGDLLPVAGLGPDGP